MSFIALIGKSISAMNESLAAHNRPRRSRYTLFSTLVGAATIWFFTYCCGAQIAPVFLLSTIFGFFATAEFYRPG